MTLQASGQIALSDLKTAYGSGANDLNSYHRMGSAVWGGASWNGTLKRWDRWDAGNNRNLNVPVSGQIALSNFYSMGNT